MVGPAPTLTDAVPAAASAGALAADTPGALTATGAPPEADADSPATVSVSVSETEHAATDDSPVDITDSRPTRPAAVSAATLGLTGGKNSGAGLTGTGSFLVMLIPALIGCVIGFLLTGATSIPPLAGYGLILGSVVAGLRVAPRLGWFPVCLPPLVMLVVVATAGQVTLIGSRPTIAREATMIMANLAATAPAQMASVAVIAVFVFVRRRRAAR